MRDKQVSSLYFIVFVKKISACLQINTDVFFYKNHDGELQDMSFNYLKFIFFQRGNYGTPFLMIWCHIAWNRFHISKIHYLFIFTSQTNKSLLNWAVLILIEQNIILKTRNRDFSPSKIEYVIILMKWLVRLILLLFLVVYRSTFKVVLTISRILFCKKSF